MKHLAVIQFEFLKHASNWDDLSYDEQITYLQKHKKSKRKITAKPKSENKISQNLLVITKSNILDSENNSRNITLIMKRNDYIPDLYVSYSGKNANLYDDKSFVKNIMTVLKSKGYDGPNFSRAELGMQPGEKSNYIVLEGNDKFGQFAEEKFNWINQSKYSTDKMTEEIEDIGGEFLGSDVDTTGRKKVKFSWSKLKNESRDPAGFYAALTVNDDIVNDVRPQQSLLSDFNDKLDKKEFLQWLKKMLKTAIIEKIQYVDVTFSKEFFKEKLDKAQHIVFDTSNYDFKKL
jgi:hypothetical protein